ncbi:DUF1499 domain-containing protein [Erythrobacter sp.]|jgi:uncharacterized protein (DUF1499 family)|uniref:DUF1499 domain-containing protein n=1 Tax=Erythrobacter sp. TaxID=1042 RepID=UPI002EAB359C|nr:DUF1499 domain-containing protein [Erythrobacter sp.]
MRNLPWHSKLVLALLIFLPLYFAMAALGTKFGVWSWVTGLVSMIFTAGPILLGIVAAIALISLLISFLRKPRRRAAIAIAVAGLVVPGVIFAGFLTARSTAGDNPIHDVATDTADPPQFSRRTMIARAEAEANPLHDYQTPLGELEMYEGSPPELAIKSHAQIINDIYAELSPLPLGGASQADGVAAVAAAMGNMGLTDIRSDAQSGLVEGVAETFWFGFEDDVVARVGPQQIDFRSVSRVGRSDLGVNAARIAELRERTAQQIGQR